MSKRKMVSGRVNGSCQLEKYVAGARGHQLIFGTPEQIAMGCKSSLNDRSCRWLSFIIQHYLKILYNWRHFCFIELWNF